MSPNTQIPQKGNKKINKGLREDLKVFSKKDGGYTPLLEKICGKNKKLGEDVWPPKKKFVTPKPLREKDNSLKGDVIISRVFV